MFHSDNRKSIKPPQKTEKEIFYTWRKDKGFVKNGYIKTDKDGIQQMAKKKIP